MDSGRDHTRHKHIAKHRGLGSHCALVELESADSCIPPSLGDNLDDLATAFCRRNCQLPDRIRNSCHSTLYLSIKALGLATYASLHRTQRVKDEAWQSYTSALCPLREQLACPQAYKDDDVLFGILLLANFESMMSP